MSKNFQIWWKISTYRSKKLSKPEAGELQRKIPYSNCRNPKRNSLKQPEEKKTPHKQGEKHGFSSETTKARTQGTTFLQTNKQTKTKKQTFNPPFCIRQKCPKGKIRTFSNKWELREFVASRLAWEFLNTKDALRLKRNCNKLKLGSAGSKRKHDQGQRFSRLLDTLLILGGSILRNKRVWGKKVKTTKF